MWLVLVRLGRWPLRLQCVAAVVFARLTTQLRCLAAQCLSTEYLATPSSGAPHCVSCPASGALCGFGQINSTANFWIERDATSGQVSVYQCPLKYCDSGSQCAAGRLPYEQNPLCGALPTLPKSRAND